MGRGHEVDDVHDADPQLGGFVSQPPGRGDAACEDVAGAGAYDVRFLIVAFVGCSVPGRGAARAVFHCRVEVQPLELRLSVDYDQVHVVLAVQAVVGDRD